MAELSTRPIIVASLNAMLASRDHTDEERDLNTEEIADLIQAMAESDSPSPQNRLVHSGYWTWTPARTA